jgi:hypothetical protein
VSVFQCWKPASDPTLDVNTDCNQDIGAVGLPNAGSTVISVQTGEQPLLGGWACGSSSDPIAFPVTNPCFLRLVDGDPQNKTGVITVPITFLTTTPVVPEVPYAVLLPVGAIGAVGAAALISRRRRVANA